MAAYTNNPGTMVTPKSADFRKAILSGSPYKGTDGKTYYISGGNIWLTSGNDNHYKLVATYDEATDTIDIKNTDEFPKGFANDWNGVVKNWTSGGKSYTWSGSTWVNKADPADIIFPGNPNTSGLSNEALARKIIEEQRQAYQDAYKANLSRYTEAKEGYKQLYTTDMEGLGTQQYRDIGQQYRKLGGELSQDMVSRGLIGTTIAPTMRTSLKTNEIAARNRVAEALQQQKLGYKSQYLNFLGTANDVYPDVSKYYPAFKDLGYFG